MQRIASNKNVPRGTTLNLLCEVLELDIAQLNTTTDQKKEFAAVVIDGISLIIINLLIMSIFGFLNLDSSANINTRFASILISLLLPYFIISKTQNLSGVQRVSKFGMGLIIYFVLVAIKIKFPLDLMTGFYPSIIITLYILHYGDSIIKMK